jgi:ESS family glutamate:Na+ symporter
MIELQPEGVVLVRPFLAVTAGILVLFLGKAVNRRIAPLRDYNIPEPVTGGLLLALVLWMVYTATAYQITFDLNARDILLVYFFTAIGLNARFSDLKVGGRPLVMLAASVAVFLLLQNSVGIAIATLLGSPPALGVLAGSVSLLGGHGTAIAWAPTIAAQARIENALEIGVLCATAGLVLASVAGGPVVRYLVTRHRLHGPAEIAPDVGVHYDGVRPPVDYYSFLSAILAIHLSAIVGILLYQALTHQGINIPLFVPCLIAAIILTNLLPLVAPRAPWPSRTPAGALIAEVTLGVFLAMSLMSMQLWTLSDLAGRLLIILAVQVALIVVFAAFVLFRMLGRTYDAAVICAGFVGFGLGATPTAMANMTAVTQRHGASHIPFLIVPLVGAFFLDVLNTIVIRLFVGLV